MDPLVTGTSIDLSPGHVIAVALAGVTIGLIGVAIRHFLLASGYELGDLVHRAADHVSARAYRRRMETATPWHCSGCRSHNRMRTDRCYRCGRPHVEAAPLTADPPSAGPATGLSAGLSDVEGLMRPRDPR